MKIRQGFVSNSSSSSFIVDKYFLSRDQINCLLELCKHPVGQWQDSWNVYETAEEVHGSTMMDNGGSEDGLMKWMIDNNFPMDRVIWEDD